jgi:hypothetical protein
MNSFVFSRIQSVLRRAALCAALSAMTFAHAEVVLVGGSYSEDFNTLAPVGTSAVVPLGWAFSESGPNANATYTANNGTSNAGDTYSYGTSGSTERAFGMLQSGSLVSTIGVEFWNLTGSTVGSLDITYTGEQWRLGATGRADRIDFQWSTNAASLTTGTWVDHDALDFSSPNTTGAIGALDGNVVGNRTMLSSTVTGLNVAPGARFWLRWTDLNIVGAEDGLAVDQFLLTSQAVSEPQPYALILAGLGLLGFALRRRAG